MKLKKISNCTNKSKRRKRSIDEAVLKKIVNEPVRQLCCSLVLTSDSKKLICLNALSGKIQYFMPKPDSYGLCQLNQEIMNLNKNNSALFMPLY